MEAFGHVAIGLALGGAITLVVGVLARRRHEVERRLLATLMHDLRTPLTSLQLTLGELSHHEGYSGEERDTLARAIEEAVALRSFLENLRVVEVAALSVAEDTPERTAVALGEQVERLRYRYGLVARTRGAELEIDAAAVTVLADPRLVELVLANVVELALFGRAPRVRVALTCAGDDFQLTCEAPGAEWPSPMSVERYAATRADRARVEGMRALAAVAALHACEVSGWALVRESSERLIVRGPALQPA